MMKVCLIYDFLTTKNTKGIIKQSKKLSIFGNVLEKLDLEISYNIPTFNQDYFYSLINIQSLQNIYNDICLDNLTKESLDYIKKSVEDFDILITYELSQNSREILDYLEIKYIDIWLSPIRFYKDVLFEFYSNDKKILNQIKSFEFDDKKFYKRANKIRSHCNEFFEKPKIKSNSCLLISQMTQDKSVLKNKAFLTLLDFKDELEKLSTKYKVIYLLKHPFLKDEEFLEIKNKLSFIKNLKTIDGLNTYQLLSSKKVKCVAGISSSVLIEAKYFDKKTKMFYKPVIPDTYTKVYKSFFKSSFWNKVLNLKKQKRVDYFVDDNYLRLKYNLIYSYNTFLPTTIEKEFDLNKKYRVTLRLMQFIDSLDRNDSYILYGWGSVAKLIYPFIKNNIVVIVDKIVSEKQKEFNGIPIVNIDEIKSYPNHKILITPFKYKEQINLELKKYRNEIINIYL